jgi:excisionase family DNA binding protein
MEENKDEFLTAQEVAARLKLHLTTIYTYINASKLPAVKLDGVVRIRASDLEAFLTAHSTTGGRSS